MESSFEASVRAAFQDLIGDGRLRVVDTRYDPLAFGNALVTMAGGGLLLRLASDRGDIYGDVAREAEPDEWFPLQFAIAVVDHGDPAEGPFSIAGFAEEVRRCWSKLADGFGAGWESTKRELDRLLEISRTRFLEHAREVAASATPKKPDRK